MCGLIDSCYKKTIKLYICVYIFICKINVFIWKLGENPSPSHADCPRSATNHSKGHDLQVMKVALASRPKPLLIHSLSEHKTMCFLSVQPVCLCHLTEQSRSSPRMDWVCFGKGVLSQLPPSFLLF